MAHPRPIIVPGQSGLGGTASNMQFNVDLGTVKNIFDFLTGAKRKQREVEEAKTERARQMLIGLTRPSAGRPTGIEAPVLNQPISSTPRGGQFVPLPREIPAKVAPPVLQGFESIPENILRTPLFQGILKTRAERKFVPELPKPKAPLTPKKQELLDLKIAKKVVDINKVASETGVEKRQKRLPSEVKLDALSILEEIKDPERGLTTVAREKAKRIFAELPDKSFLKDQLKPFLGFKKQKSLQQQKEDRLLTTENKKIAQQERKLKLQEDKAAKIKVQKEKEAEAAKRGSMILEAIATFADKSKELRKKGTDIDAVATRKALAKSFTPEEVDTIMLQLGFVKPK